MSDPTMTRNPTILGRLLRAIRTLPPVPNGAAAQGTSDFFGSPVRALGIDMPNLEVHACQHVQGGKSTRIEFPPVEGSPVGAEPFLLIDWEAIARMRQEGLHENPHSTLVFLELLRCIAAPFTGSEGTLIPSGVFRPHLLPQEYFLEDPDDPGDYKRATRTLRTSFLSVYTYVLIRCLVERKPEWGTSIFGCPDSDERIKRLRNTLDRTRASEEDKWAPIHAAAVLFVGSQTFHQFYHDAVRANQPPRILRYAAGPRPKSFHALFREEFGETRRISLPAPLALLLQINLDDRNQTGTLPLLPKALREHAHVLYDEHRVERVEHMLRTNGSAPWLTVDFTAEELTPGTTKPSLSYINHACFCMLVERLLTTDCALNVESDVVEKPTMQPNLEVVRKWEEAVTRQIESLGEKVAEDAGRLRRRSDETRGARLRETSPRAFYFSDDGLATLTRPQRRGVPFTCTVQRTSGGLQAIGTIWVPVPRHLVQNKLTIELQVLRFELTSEAACGWRLIPLPAMVTDYFIVDEGALLCLELERAADGALPGGLRAATFRTQATMRMEQVPSEEGEATTLSCVIACIDDTP
jgi:hypothetical protein